MWNKLAELATENLDKGMQIQVRSHSAVQSLTSETTNNRALTGHQNPQWDASWQPYRACRGSQSGDGHV